MISPPMAGGLVLPGDGEAALFLDLDGTLLDIAASPDAVVVPAGLVESLVAWRGRLGGALAVVTGRPIEQVDGLLPGAVTAVAGEHGGAIRRRPDGPIERPYLAEMDGDWMAAMRVLAAAHPGVLLEPKRRGFAMHYRAAPDRGAVLQAAIAALIAPRAAEFALLPAHMAWEVRPVGADKGTAVTALMQRAPFAGRLPVFVGDDVTDEDGMAAAVALGGVGLRVPEMFGGAGEVRAWLR